MKYQPPRNAGLISVIAAAVVLILVYTLLGTVDLVYVDGNREIYRQKDASVISDYEIPEGDFVYTSGDETKELGDGSDLKVDIGIKVLMNLVTFKWNETDNVIIFEAK